MQSETTSIRSPNISRFQPPKLFFDTDIPEKKDKG